ncbi:hypothetical protein Tco_0056668 [Tanacetum coccineum]
MVREEFNEEEQRLNLDLLQERREAAAIREARYKSKMEQYYNKKVRPAGFRPGEFVYRRNEASRVEDQGKLGPKWEGPYRVTEAFENGSYKLQTMEDKMLVNVIARTPSFNGESNFPMNACYNHWINKSHRQPSHRVKMIRKGTAPPDKINPTDNQVTG